MLLNFRVLFFVQPFKMAIFAKKYLFLRQCVIKTGIGCNSFYSAYCVGEGFGQMVANNQIYEKNH